MISCVEENIAQKQLMSANNFINNDFSFSALLVCASFRAHAGKCCFSSGMMWSAALMSLNRREIYRQADVDIRSNRRWKGREWNVDVLKLWRFP